MRWRGKFRDSLESKCGPGKIDTPKVSGNGPCSLNIRSYPPAQPPTICILGGGFAGLRKTALLRCGGRGVFLQGGIREVVFSLSNYPVVMLLGKSLGIMILILYYLEIMYLSSNLICVLCAY